MTGILSDNYSCVYTVLEWPREVTPRSFDTRTSRGSMALATSMPVIGDLTMKLSRHSIHDPLQLPASFYQCFGQAKDIALYFQPNGFFTSPKLGREKLFEFKGSSDENLKRQYESKVSNDCEKSDFTGECWKRTCSKADETRANTNQTKYANRGNSSIEEDSTEHSFRVRSQEESGEETSSDEEELTNYFSRQPEPSSVQKTSNGLRNTGKPLTSIHNRKRSMEQEEYSTVKRCCRPHLNFEKMRLNRELGRDCTGEENVMNCFRPICPPDLT